MNKFESSYSKFMGYKIACSECYELHIKPNDEAFVCSTCSAS